MSPSPPVVARLLLPDDANIAGNVHGGTILKLMEEAGMITATRHMNKNEENCIAALIRFETMAFLKPVFVGEVASCQCNIIFTSNQSMLVEVVVSAEDISKGKVRVTNVGQLWYVPMVPGDDQKKDWSKPPKVAQVPPIEPQGDDAVHKFEKAKADYETKKKKKQQEQGDSANDATVDEIDGLEEFKSQYVAPSDGRSPTESEQVLCQMVLPGDCGKGSVAFGGFVMKLMDNAAGCSAFRHCRTNVVTVAIQSMDFTSWVTLGDLCTIRSKVVFASSKSLEIEVVASVTSIAGDKESMTTVAKGLFNFVSIASDNKVLPVPKLRLETDEDMRNAYLGQQRYEAAKLARMAGKK
mmetsp:Transcript_16195/g.24454  ORF Transcript_16195/g.24454 Transcript_16195/m.24454 type:complete len:353 (+) Transcript_16195:106-1164(+)